MTEENNTTMKDRPELEEKLSELEILRQSLDEAKAAADKSRDELLRTMAEFQNFRKRSETRVSDARAYGKEEILEDVLTLGDALFHAVDATQKAADIDGLKKGVTLVGQQFEKFLKDQGVTLMKSVGETLDPNKHEAIAQEEKADVEEGTILAEIQRGYERNGRVLRTAKVRVASKPKETV